ncbi:hypothetical protein MAP00_009238 [Monascus purpureus]|nr:hypothetical protein MAP00_009238 [Monascus purpureus]
MEKELLNICWALFQSSLKISHAVCVGKSLEERPDHEIYPGEHAKSFVNYVTNKSRGTFQFHRQQARKLQMIIKVSCANISISPRVKSCNDRFGKSSKASWKISHGRPEAMILMFQHINQNPVVTVKLVKPINEEAELRLGLGLLQLLKCIHG